MAGETRVLRVLLADDDAMSRETLCRLLTQHEIFEATGYDDAGDVLRRKAVDVIVSDSLEPEKPGTELLRLAARLQPEAHRVMFSGKAPDELQQLLDRGVIHHFFAKPMHQDLLALISGLAGQSAEGSPEVPLRRHPRYAADNPVDVRCDTWRAFIALYTRDISRGGMFVVTGSPPAVGTRLQIKLHLPADHVLELAGRVAHVISPERAYVEDTQPGVGVELLDLGGATERQIDAFVEMAKLQTGGSTSPPAPKDRADRDGRPTQRRGEQAKLLEQLRADLAALKEMDDHAALGLAPDADGAAARRAFYELSKRYHPDLFARHGDPEITRAVTEIFILLKRASSRVGSRPTCAQRPTPTPPTCDAPVVADSATGKRPTDPSLKQALCHLAEGRHQEAAEELQRVLAADRDNDVARVWLFLVQARQLKQRGETERALQRYQAVLRLDEQNAEAAREVRELNEQARRSRGFLGGLFRRISG
jgi:uncharacterized protein (TIGR02266 family)